MSYPDRAWEEVIPTLGKQPRSRVSVLKYLRSTSYYRQPATSDPQGRLLIHPRLRTDAGIEEEVVILGQQNHLEVWNLKRFKETLQSDPLNAEDEDFLASLGV